MRGRERRAGSNESGVAPRPESIRAGLEWRQGGFSWPQCRGRAVLLLVLSAARQHGRLETWEPEHIGMGVWVIWE